MWGPLLGQAGRDPTANWCLQGSGKVPKEEQELRKTWSVQCSNEWSAEHTWNPGSWTWKKQFALQKTRGQSKHPPVPCVLGLAQVPPTLQQGYASRIYVKSVLTWGCETSWAKQEPLCPQGAAWCTVEAVGFPGPFGTSFVSWYLE